MAEIIQLPEGNGGAGVGNIPFSIPLGGNGMFGNGQTNLMDLLGFAIVASIFPNFFGGGYGFGGGANGAAGFLSNQINNDAGRELIMQAVTNQGEASRTAIQTLSTMLGQDFNLVNGAVSNVQNALQTLALQQAVSVPQIINTIQAGDASLAAQFQNCCCEQTNALQNAINGVGQQVQAKAADDRLAMCQQTYALTDTMNRNYLALDNKIDAMESARKDREITALTAKVAQLESQNFTTGVVQQAVSPILGQLAGIRGEVDAIKGKLPNTISVEYPQVSVVNTTPYMGSYYPGFGAYGGF